MCGHGPFEDPGDFGVFDFCPGVVGVVDCGGVVVLDPVVPVPVVPVAAEAPAMPAAAPPVAIAPATIVAPSILEIFMPAEPPYGGCVLPGAHGRPAL
jgi:hypothetical protein